MINMDEFEKFLYDYKKISQKSVRQFEKFLRDYKNFTAERVQMRIDEFKNRFGHLRTALQMIISLKRELNRYCADEFNLFRLLGVEQREVETHSAILANLLNPSGTHGQNILFLKHFLDFCADKFGDVFQIDNDIEKFKWFVDKEKVTSYGRIDIVISCPDLKFIFVIENKIRSGEQPDQLKRYGMWLESRKKYFEKRALIYLTPAGDLSSTANGYPYFHLSYHEDIVCWLERAIKEVKASRIKEMLVQYAEIIKII